MPHRLAAYGTHSNVLHDNPQNKIPASVHMHHLSAQFLNRAPGSSIAVPTAHRRFANWSCLPGKQQLGFNIWIRELIAVEQHVMRLSTLYWLLAGGLPMLLASCQSSLQVAADALARQSWQLAEINGQSVLADVPATLSIDATLRLHGFSGCNRFFGQGQWQQGRLVVPSLGMTRMACPPQRGWIETALLAALRDGATPELTATSLTLRSTRYTLHFFPVTR